MKKKQHQPHVPPAIVPAGTMKRTVIKSLLLSLPVLLSANGIVFARHFVPGFPPCGMSVSVTASPSPACIGNTLSLGATVSGGTSPYSYHWVGPVAADFTTTVTTSTTTTPPLTNDDGGFYTVTVTDATGCTASNVALVSVYSNPVLDVVATPSPVCVGNTLTLSSGFNSGGSGGGTYVWTGPNGFTSTAENGIVDNASSLTAGTYSVTVTDNHGCIGTGTTTSVSVISNTASLSVSGDVSICSGASASLSASGCTTYDWNPGTALSPTSGASVTASPTSTTVYTITGHVGNCINKETLTVVVLDNYTITASAGSNGSIAPTSINACSGTDVTYTVTPVAGYHITAVYVDGTNIGSTPPFTVHNVTTPHTVTADFAPDCTTPSITSTTNGAVCGSGTVALSVSASAGTINWYTSSTGGTSLASGGTYSPSVSATTTYYVDATDGSCISSRTAVTATVNSNPTASASVTNVNCYGGSTGAVTVTGSGGAAGYTVTGAATTGLSAGTYTYTVTDANSCTATVSATVSQPSAALAISSITANDVSCNSANGGSNSDGSIATTVSGGTGSYTYAWTGGAGAAAGANPTGLIPATYNLTVTDDNGCTATGSATVGQPTALTTSAASANVSCNSTNGGTHNDGAITLTISGGSGSGSNTYLWSNGETVQNPNDLVAGSYNVTVTNSKGCTATASATVGQPTALAITSLSPASTSCNSANGGTQNDGSITVTATGGTGSYSYAWSNGLTTTTNSLGSLTTGTYGVTVSDANGCTTAGSATVDQPSAITASSSVTNVACYGNNTGAVSVTATGGTGTYSVSGNATTGLTAGSYSYTVTDGNGCTTTTSATVSQPASALSVSSTATNVSCYGGSNGSVTVSATGGTSPYTGTGTFSNEAAGSYSYTVTDANGCTAATSATVTQPSSALTASATVTNVSCNAGSDGSVMVSATGGTSPYTGTGTNSGKTANSYSYTVTDANGCTSSVSATVSEPSALSVTGSITNVTCNGQSNGAVSTSVSGGTSGYTYLWSSSETTSGISSKAAGTYSVTVTDAHSCTASNSFTITQPSAVTSSITGSSSVLGGTTNSYSGPSGMSTYSWSVSGTGASISGSSSSSSVNIATTCSASSYTVSLTVANSGGCSNSATKAVSVTGSSTFTVYSTYYSTGSGYHPSTLKNPLTSDIKVFDRHTVGARDWSQSHYSSVWNSTTGQETNVSVSSPVSVKIGGGYCYKYTVTVPADGHYLVIGKSTLSSSAYSSGSCTVYTGSKVGDYDSVDGEDHEDDDADGGCSSSIERFHAIIQDHNGKCSEGYTQLQHGSLMLMVSPAALDFTDTVALLPMVYESVDGTWDVSVTADPPSGFYATPSDSLSTSVIDSEINAVQFSITDTGSEWTNTKLTHHIYHKGAYRTAYSAPKMVNDRTNKPSQIILSPNPATDEISVVLTKFEGKATINIYNLLGQKVAEQPINVSGPTPTMMDVSSLAPGVYMVTAENSYGKATGRLVKTAR